MKTKSLKKVVSLPNELIIGIFDHIPTRQLVKFMGLSRTMNFEIRKIIINRFNSTFWNPHRRILVMITRYVLDFVPIHNTFDLGFKKLDKDSLMATFQHDSTFRSGTVGPHNKKLWGFKLRGDGVLRDNPLNEPLIYTVWDSPYEQKETRIYTFDSKTDPSHPIIKTYFVTNGSLKTPCDACEDSKGFWSWKLFNSNSRKDKGSSNPKVEIEGRNEKKVNGPNEEVIGTLKTIRIKAPMLLVSIEEQKKDKYIAGLKYLIMEGGQHFLKRRRNCIIS